MGFINRANAAWKALRGSEIKNDPLELLRQIYATQLKSIAGKTVNVETAMRVSAALACGRVKAQGIATMPLKLMRKVGNRIEPAVNHRLYDRLMSAPNDIQTAYEFKEQFELHLSFCGNAYVWITTVSRGIDELYLLEPGWVKVKYQWPDPPTYIVKIPGRKEIELNWKEIWHVKGPSWCTYLGLDTIVLAREALGLSMALEEGQASFQAKGVRTSGFLSIEGTVNAEQHAKLRKWIGEEHAGSENDGTPMILDHAAKWNNQSVSNVDAQTVEMRSQQIEEVCRFMGVLPIMIGHSDKTATYASSEQMFLAHLVHTMGPEATRIENSADRWLLSDVERRDGYYFKFNEKALIRMSAKDQAEYLFKMSGGPMIGRNEARGFLDLNPIDDLEDPLSPVNMVAGPPPTTDTMRSQRTNNSPTVDQTAVNSETA